MLGQSTNAVCRVAACMLTVMLVALVVPHASAQVRLQPTADGMSVAGMFQAAVEKTRSQLLNGGADVQV